MSRLPLRIAGLGFRAGAEAASLFAALAALAALEPTWLETAAPEEGGPQNGGAQDGRARDGDAQDGGPDAGRADFGGARSGPAGRGHGGIADVAVPAAKAGHPALHALAACGIRVHAVTAAALRAQATPTQSDASRRSHGTGSVAEACALAALGPGARLVAARVISPDRMATAALAEGAPE